MRWNMCGLQFIVTRLPGLPGKTYKYLKNPKETGGSSIWQLAVFFTIVRFTRLQHNGPPCQSINPHSPGASGQNHLIEILQTSTQKVLYTFLLESLLHCVQYQNSRRYICRKKNKNMRKITDNLDKNVKSSLMVSCMYCLGKESKHDRLSILCTDRKS